MTLRAETLNFLRELERFFDRTLSFRDEVGMLIEVAGQKGKMGAFNDAIFLAKFITKSMGVMKRIGVDGEGYDKLSAEFQSNIQKVSAFLKEILEVAPEDARRSMAPFFLSLTHDSLEHLMILLSDLAIVKNWVLDGKQLPGEPAAR
jgi:hypothetical protein